MNHLGICSSLTPLRAPQNKVYICFALATIAVACASTQEIPPAEEDQAAQSWASANKEILVQLSAGGSDSACEKVATDVKKDVKNTCKAAQKLIDDIDSGMGCCIKGEQLVAQAHYDLDTVKAKHATCKTQLDSALNTKVTFSNVNYEDLTDGKCHSSFFSGSSYKNAKKKVEDKTKECTTLEGKVDGAQKALEAARIERDSRRKKCRVQTRKDIDKQFTASVKLCETDKQKKAWARSHHLMCVLKKSTLADCKVPSLPKLKKQSVDFNLCNAEDQPIALSSSSKWTATNGWDGKADLKCGGTSVLVGQKSYHDNKKEDRRFTNKCREITNESGNFAAGSTFSTGYFNNWKANFEKANACGDGALPYGTYSYHNNKKEDRRFKFYCRKYKGLKLTDAKWNSSWNSYDGKVDYTCGSGRVMIGMKSNFNDGANDRKFKFRCANAAIVNTDKENTYTKPLDKSGMCSNSPGKGHKSIRGFHISSHNPKVGFLYTMSSTWDPKKVYFCPIGWRWGTRAEFQANCKSGSGHNGYSKCGCSGYTCAGQSKTYFRFSDSRAGMTAQYTYAHMGSGECGVSGQDGTKSSFAGIICIRN